MRPVFSAAQRKALAALGLYAEQIDGLQATLPLIRSMLAPLSTATEIRMRWAALEKPLNQARRALTALVASDLADAVEARVRLLDAANNPDLFDEALAGISTLEAAFSTARGKLPTQRRAHQATWQPIGQIADALLNGFVKHFNPGHPTAAQVSALPPYMLRVSRTEPFADVARICYQAIGRDQDPDRAIRVYLKITEVAAYEMRKKAGLPPEHLVRPRRGRPKK